jgi:hypothetical protein
MHSSKILTTRGRMILSEILELLLGDMNENHAVCRDSWAPDELLLS